MREESHAFYTTEVFSMSQMSLISQTPCLWAFFSDISDIEVCFWGCFLMKNVLIFVKQNRSCTN